MKKKILSALACSAMASGLMACGDNGDMGLLINRLPAGNDECSEWSSDDNMALKPEIKISDPKVYFVLTNTLAEPENSGQSLRTNTITPISLAYQFDCLSEDSNKSFCSNIGYSDDRTDFEGDQWTIPLSGPSIGPNDSGVFWAQLNNTPNAAAEVLMRVQVKGVTDSGQTVRSPVFTSMVSFASTCTTVTTDSGTSPASCWCKNL